MPPRRPARCPARRGVARPGGWRATGPAGLDRTRRAGRRGTGQVAVQEGADTARMGTLPTRPAHGDSMARIVSLATASPPHVVTQAEAREFSRRLFARAYPDVERLLEIFDNAQIEKRHVAAPVEWFEEERSFPERNARYVEEAVRLTEAVAREAIAGAGLAPGDIDHLLLVSTTGIAAPSLDARLMNRIPFSPHMRRTPIWGLGCAGGAAGVARAAEWAEHDGGATVLLVSVEMCSLTFQGSDLSKSNLVATALFGDGAAAAVLRGERKAPDDGPGPRPSHARGSAGRPPGPRVVASRSTLFPDTEDVMGWDVNDAGLRVL